MSTQNLQDHLRTLSRLNVDIELNDNRTTMIRIVERRRKYIRLSIHRMFLKASGSVIKAVVDFIHNYKDSESSKLLKNYIDTNLSLFNYHEKLDKSKLITLGQVYDLKMIYHKLNKTYFDNSLDLNITWFGTPKKKKGTQMTYGLYHEPLKLIKIHRLLDRTVCPSFFLEYVIYHEMLHEIHRPSQGVKNRHIHTKEFLEEEKLFRHYKKAVEWEKKSQSLFFR